MAVDADPQLSSAGLNLWLVVALPTVAIGVALFLAKYRSKGGKGASRAVRGGKVNQTGSMGATAKRTAGKGAKKPQSTASVSTDVPTETEGAGGGDSASSTEATGAADELEVWEIPLEPTGAPITEREKALLKAVKKLREVKHIEKLICAGETVEPNRQAKADKRGELLEEWCQLFEDVQWERGHVGSSREFVSVKSGVSASSLRSEAFRLVEDQQAASERARAEASERARAEAVAESTARKTRSRHNRAKKSKGDGADGGSDGDWVKVGNDGKPKEKKSSDDIQDPGARQEAQRRRCADKVLSTQTEEYRLTMDSLQSMQLFSAEESQELERLIDQVTVDAERGLFKDHTVDLTPMRNKYFFGFAYTYGAQKEHAGARGVEAVWPPEDTSPIPDWIQDMVISRLEARRLVPKGWINAATINDYAAGGCIVSHIDPPHLFDRPIVSVSMFSDCNLVFGTRFAFPKEAKQDIETSTPVLVHPCLRGHATVLKGYSANKITHAIRPCDLPSRRASIILRRVLPSAPVLVDGKVVPLSEHLKQCRTSERRGHSLQWK